MNKIKNIICGVNSVEKLFNTLGKITSKKLKGDVFEELSYWIFKIHPYYRNIFKEVYRFSEVPASILKEWKLPSIDKGLDLIAIGINGRRYGIQAKFRKQNMRTIPWKELATFPALSFTCDIEEAIFITNCDNVCKELMNNPKIHNVCGIFWKSITNEFYYHIKKSIKHNSVEVIRKAIVERSYQKPITLRAKEYFQGRNEGTLIMACGTGKTLQSYFITQSIGAKRYHNNNMLARYRPKFEVLMDLVYSD